ncbi:unnamed protein product [Merluccius merluccius]
MQEINRRTPEDQAQSGSPCPADRYEQMCNNSWNYRYSPGAAASSTTTTTTTSSSVCPPNFCLGTASSRIALGGMDLRRHGRGPRLSTPLHQ